MTSSFLTIKFVGTAISTRGITEISDTTFLESGLGIYQSSGVAAVHISVAQNMPLIRVDKGAAQIRGKFAGRAVEKLVSACSWQSSECFVDAYAFTPHQDINNAAKTADANAMKWQAICSPEMQEACRVAQCYTNGLAGVRKFANDNVGVSFKGVPLTPEDYVGNVVEKSAELMQKSSNQKIARAGTVIKNAMTVYDLAEMFYGLVERIGAVTREARSQNPAE